MVKRVSGAAVAVGGAGVGGMAVGAAVMALVLVGRGVALAIGVAVSGGSVAVTVAVGGIGVAVGGTAVAVAVGVLVGGTGVAEGVMVRVGRATSVADSRLAVYVGWAGKTAASICATTISAAIATMAMTSVFLLTSHSFHVRLGA
ncbi:MAG: hypothetical protein GXX94_00530 [Chloroflexi bacterium]|nr:hypothetical protein [Chloroflexota bacterium]